MSTLTPTQNIMLEHLHREFYRELKNGTFRKCWEIIEALEAYGYENEADRMTRELTQEERNWK